MTYQIKQKNGLYFGVKPENLRKEYEDRVKDCPTELFDTALSVCWVIHCWSIRMRMSNLLIWPQCCNEDPTLRPSMEKNLTTIQKLYNNYNNFITISHSKIFNKEGSELWVNLLTKVVFHTPFICKCPITFFRIIPQMKYQWKFLLITFVTNCNSRQAEIWLHLKNNSS